MSKKKKEKKEINFLLVIIVILIVMVVLTFSGFMILFLKYIDNTSSNTQTSSVSSAQGTVKEMPNSNHTSQTEITEEKPDILNADVEDLVGEHSMYKTEGNTIFNDGSIMGSSVDIINLKEPSGPFKASDIILSDDDKLKYVEKAISILKDNLKFPDTLSINDVSLINRYKLESQGKFGDSLDILIHFQAYNDYDIDPQGYFLISFTGLRNNNIEKSLNYYMYMSIDFLLWSDFTNPFSNPFYEEFNINLLDSKYFK